MPEKSANNQTAIHNEVAYATSWEHLSDELRRLEMVIHLQVLKQRNWHLANPLDQFKGLVVSEDEITELLTDAASVFAEENLVSPGNLQTQILTESLSQLEFQI